MKKKVLCYSSNGDTVVRKHVELIQLDGDIYYILDGHSAILFYHFEGKVFCEITNCSKSNLTRIEEIKTFATNYFDSIFTKKFVSLIDIELLKELEYPQNTIDELIEKRRIYLENREQAYKKEQEEKNEKKLKEAEQRKNKDLEDAHKALDNLRNDKEIYFSDLLNLCNHLNIDLHIRTKGFLMKEENSTCSIKKGSGTFKKRTSTSTMNTLWEVVEKILEMEIQINN